MRYKTIFSIIATIMDQLQLMRADFGSRLDHLTVKMYQMNTKIGRIARRQSCLNGFIPSPEHDPSVKSSNSGDDHSDDTSGFAHDDEMTVS